ncbi:hypothetical protein FHW16_002033 [Phyllobacterium myrsinacearum]|uniref:Uncharacterized protein n=1 Tax=Phyllobacterium myrsinacearum TaxID=28101 RepID=A0A839EEE7_9HYPH|nr:hypothetical protein [Phyllobacterium myrsinacearum]
MRGLLSGNLRAPGSNDMKRVSIGETAFLLVANRSRDIRRQETS